MIVLLAESSCGMTAPAREAAVLAMSMGNDLLRA